MQLPRTPMLSEDEFIKMHLIANTPLIVTEAIQDWNLFWHPDEWNKHFGQELVQVYDDLFNLMDVIPLASFLDKFMKSPEKDQNLVYRPYVRWYTKMKNIDFVWADEVFAKIADNWSLPEFLPRKDYLFPNSHDRCVDPARDLFPAKGLFISGVGACTRLHQDPWSSDAVLCQLFGRKRVILFSPSQEYLFIGDKAVADLSKLNEILSSNISQISPAYDDILQPGEVLFIPSGWYHHVISLTESISLTWNFVHRSTWNRFFRYLAATKTQSELEVLQFFSELP
jgi:hypothetical protein